MSKSKSKKFGFSTALKVIFEATADIPCAVCGRMIRKGERFKRSVVGEVGHKKTLPTCRQCEPFEERVWDDAGTTLMVDTPRQTGLFLSVCKVDGRYRLKDCDVNKISPIWGQEFDSIESLLAAEFPGEVTRWWL